MVSKAREDLPEPESPVTTINLFLGILMLIFFKLFCLALIISINSEFLAQLSDLSILFFYFVFICTNNRKQKYFQEKICQNPKIFDTNYFLILAKYGNGQAVDSQQPKT
jgi:hypothetical protein